MPTTGGFIGMKDSVPPADAYTVEKMRKAGALILAKAKLQEFARGGMSVSSLGGQVLILAQDALKGARIGVMINMFGTAQATQLRKLPASTPPLAK